MNAQLAGYYPGSSHTLNPWVLEHGHWTELSRPNNKAIGMPFALQTPAVTYSEGLHRRIAVPPV
jgi:hypothetical protein